MVDVIKIIREYELEIHYCLDSTFVEAGIDSLMFVRLIVDIENEANITFPEEGLDLRRFKKLRDIEEYANYLIEKGQG